MGSKTKRNADCVAFEKGIQLELPGKQTKKKRRIEEKTVLILRDEEGRILLHRREDKGLLAGMWELPEKKDALSNFVEICDLVEAGEATHIFSHVEWHMSALTGTVRLTGSEAVAGGRVAEETRPYLRDVKEEIPQWILASPKQIREEIALPSAFKGFRHLILGEEI